MKKEMIKQFVKKTIVKIVIFAVCMCVIHSIVYSMNPLITNEIALAQMQNSNEAYVIMNTYFKSRPILIGVYFIVCGLFGYRLGCDTIKFVKNINSENEKEN